MTQWQVGSATATQIVSAGDPETLIVNKNTKYGILIGNDSATGSGTQSDTTPLGPYESLVVNGNADVFAIAQTAGTTCLVVCQTNAILWTPKAIQPNIQDPHSPYNPGTGVHVQILNVPPGAQGLFIAWPAASHSQITNITVTGNQSGITYYNQNPNNLYSAEAWIPVLSDGDQTVSVSTITSAGIVLTMFWLMNSFMAGAVDTGLDTNVNIAAINFNGGTIPITVSSPLPVTFSGTTQPVSLSPIDSRQLVPTSKPVQINQSLAAGSTGVIIPAVAGLTVYLHKLRIEAVAAVAFDCDIQDTSGNTIATAFQEIIGAPAATFRPPLGDMDFGGAPIGLMGVGLQLKNSGGAAQQFVGFATYSAF